MLFYTSCRDEYTQCVLYIHVIQDKRAHYTKSIKHYRSMYSVDIVHKIDKKHLILYFYLPSPCTKTECCLELNI